MKITTRKSRQNFSPQNYFMSIVTESRHFYFVLYQEESHFIQIRGIKCGLVFIFGLGAGSYRKKNRTFIIYS